MDIKIQHTKSGLPYYFDLPAEFREAVESDFTDEYGAVLLGKAYLIRSFHSGTYQAYRVTRKFTIEKIKPWLDERRVFVLK